MKNGYGDGSGYGDHIPNGLLCSTKTDLISLVNNVHLEDLIKESKE